MTNCPNCGAPIVGWRCEYCDTVFDISKRDQCLHEISLLEAKTRCLQDAIVLQDVYNTALLAMRSYALTPNEARELVGLKGR